MINIRYATESDQAFWLSHDTHISEGELLLKIRDRRGYVICDKEHSMGAGPRAAHAKDFLGANRVADAHLKGRVA